jgi:biopolymer transport protein ExbB
MWEVIQKGGPLMWPILACSFIAFVIIVERIYFLRKAYTDTRKFSEQISRSVKRNRIMDAIDLCEKTGGPVAQVLKAGILKHDRPRAEIREAIEDAAIHEVPVLERRLPVLATIAHITPLLGLLGTVTGMVEAFQGDPDHKCMGRSAPARLDRVLAQAQEAGLDVRQLKIIKESKAAH